MVILTLDQCHDESDKITSLHSLGQSVSFLSCACRIADPDYSVPVYPSSLGGVGFAPLCAIPGYALPGRPAIVMQQVCVLF